jgi:hypothetical protein
LSSGVLAKIISNATNEIAIGKKVWVCRRPSNWHNYADQGSGYFFHGKMPGCCLPSRTAATTLHVTAGYLKLLRQQDPTPCFAFLGGNSPLPIKSTGAIILS